MELRPFFTKTLSWTTFVHFSNPGAKNPSLDEFLGIYALCCRIFGDLCTFWSNFVATDIYALLLKSYPEDFRPILSWAEIWVAPLGEDTNQPPKPPYPEEPDGLEDTDNQEPERIIDKQGSDDGAGDKNDETDAAGESDDTSEEDNETDYRDYSVCSSQSERDMASYHCDHSEISGWSMR